jgi:hypothetical protein
MLIEEISQIITADLKIDRMNLVDEASRTPNLFTKYLAMFQEEKLKLKAAKRKYFSVYKSRREFYMGTAPEEDYREEANERKVLRQDVEIWLDADNKLQTQQDRVSYQECIVDMLERTLKEINSRTFHIKEMIAMIRFESGM